MQCIPIGISPRCQQEKRLDEARRYRAAPRQEQALDQDLKSASTHLDKLPSRLSRLTNNEHNTKHNPKLSTLDNDKTLSKHSPQPKFLIPEKASDAETHIQITVKTYKEEKKL